MASFPTPKRRRNPESLSSPQQQYNKPKKPISENPKKSSSSLLSSLMEPSSNFFPSKSEFLKLMTVLFIAASVAISCNFFVGFLNRPAKPFCDSGTDFHDSISDICEPCPSHGECYEGRLECVHGYKKHGKICVEDGEINEKARKLSEFVQRRVCESYAMYLCHGSGTVWTSEDEIWNDLDEIKLMENFGVDNSIAVIKLKAAVSLDRLLEEKTNSLGAKKVKCPDVLAEQYKPFACRIREWLSKHALVLIPVFALLVGCSFLFGQIRRRGYLSIRAEELYEQVCDILEEQALMSKSVNREGEPWVVASWLRDHLLLPKERKDPALWKKVEDLVQEDSRLDRFPKLVKGESKVVWEWQVEGSLSSSRKRKKGREGILKSSEGIRRNLDQPRELKSGQLLHC